MYLSDISGAFDRVSAELLLKKLRAAGVNDAALQFLESYLQERNSTVVVGNSSRNAEIRPVVPPASEIKTVFGQSKI